MIGFLAGLAVGVPCGWLVLGLCVSSARADDYLRGYAHGRASLTTDDDRLCEYAERDAHLEVGA